ncbi:MAG: hypothetical protein VX228_02575 [Pseudomonadota bacterium]|nr:hypothetical protein [Pseudomonadota bacterium]
MKGEMVFAQFNVRDLMLLIRELDHVELGLLIRIAVENFLALGGLRTNRSDWWRLLGCKSNKTFNKHLEALLEKGVVKEDDGSIIACIAEKAIDHFIAKSMQGKVAVACRQDRQQRTLDLTDTPQSSLSLTNGDALPANASESSPKNDYSEIDAPFDLLIDNLKQLCERKGQLVLRDALDKEDAQRKVEEWFVRGTSPEALYNEISQVMKAKGSKPISSWNFFSKAVDAITSGSR